MCHGLDGKWIVAETEARLAGLPRATLKTTLKTRDRIVAPAGLIARMRERIAGWMRKEVADV